jgi:coenzyme F420-dependent glucose-6-phosphate dehydrogenase
MALFGFHASHELFPPSALLRHVQQAEQAGFEAAMCSDHFHPWMKHGQSGYSFAWLGAALQATGQEFGTVCCPTGRYHPAMVAQAAATLAEMFPDRFWLAVGTGQALNEHITGERWPTKPERQARLREAVDIIRALWAGETVQHRGRVRTEGAKLYSRPQQPPLLLGAATSPETARWLGGWADGLLTMNAEPEPLSRLVQAFREGGGEGKPMFLQAMVGYDPDEERAWAAAAQNWPIAVLSQEELQDWTTPEQFTAGTAKVRATDLKGKLRVSADLGQHIGWIQQDLALGFDRIFLYTVSGSPERFLDVFGAKVLPACRSRP